MNSPNTNTLMTLLSDAFRSNPKLTAVGFKITYEGEDKTPISILEMDPIRGDAWKKSASFKSLSSTVCGQIGVHNTAYLISIISQEMPIDITTALMEFMKIKEALISRMTDINTLSGVDFLSSSSNTAVI